MPSIHAFGGEYGPFKAKGFDPIEKTLIWLCNGGEDVDDLEEQYKRRHAIYPLAGPIQDLLLSNNETRFTTVLVIDINDMFESREESQEALDKETEKLELTKKFGKKLFHLFQKLLVRRVAIATRGELCPLLFKLYKALKDIDAIYQLEENNTISELWLLYPELSTKYINTHLVVGEGGYDS